MAGNGTGAARGGASKPVPPNRRKPSPAVYRRRRLAVLLLALVLVGLLVFAVLWIASLFGPGQQPVAEEPAELPVASSSPSLSPQPLASSASCDESDITVSAATDAPAYVAGENPTLILEVENTGKSDCEVDVGTEAMEFVVTSGDDRIFSSKDCAVDTSELMRTIEAGGSERAQFTWERQRSAPGCTAVNANPQPGTYVLVTKLGQHTSKKVIFELQ
ncbi:hypothetical protein D477_015988 [Arthrobacter crystallopoietes BAB-32]|uniref:DUF4232 domain-containing protein n=1 Tax=Arthrobacter crystallopoietes BAB-32 TaxID=1246476 RepID=N1UZK6_9MICC|nr:hypothetical protein [Arthrobacter crystallopoietes]EMY33247.1 hypothetical protein D477_015988 [Arthrobacter crystallopoietes BAB-32]